jgi:hypothetical protein
MPEQLKRYVRAVKAGCPVHNHPSRNGWLKVCRSAAQQGSVLEISNFDSVEDFFVMLQFSAVKVNMSSILLIWKPSQSLQVRQVLDNNLYRVSAGQGSLDKGAGDFVWGIIPVHDPQPLSKGLARLHCLVDHNVHFQQMQT